MHQQWVRETMGMEESDVRKREASVYQYQVPVASYWGISSGARLVYSRVFR